MNPFVNPLSRMRLRLRLRSAALPLALASLLAAGCGGSASSLASLSYSSPTPVEPTAGTWRTWIVPDPVALRPAAPPSPESDQTSAELAELAALAAARTPAQEADIATWNLGTCKRWNELQRSLIAARSVNPPKASRGLAMACVAMYDAMVCAWDAKFAFLRARPNAHPGGPTPFGAQPDSPSYVSERACASAAAAVVLRNQFPLDVAAIDALLQSALDADLNACVHFRSDVEVGEALGEAVGQMVIDARAADGSAGAQSAYAESGLPGRWIRTPPGNVFPPLLPGWGGVTTWALASGSQFRPPAPPAFLSAEWNTQTELVRSVVGNPITLSPERQAIALFWADGGGTVTPPGHWNQIAVDLGASEGLSEPRMARMLALLGVAQADAFIACWECKYFYDIQRPITAIRDALDPAWNAFIVTPPFPTYPSGHSTTSGAASQVLGYLFPDQALDLAQMGTEAMDSRLFGGIHFDFDDKTGLDMGRSIANVVIGFAAEDGSP